MTAVRDDATPSPDGVHLGATDRDGARYPSAGVEEEPMDHDPRCCARIDPTPTADPAPAGDAPIDPLTGPPTAVPDVAGLPPEENDQLAQIDWVEAQTELDRCDGYVVLAVDPQTGEVDAHGPFPGIDAIEIADDMRATLDREGLDDVVVRVVRWHQDRTGDSAA